MKITPQFNGKDIEKDMQAFAEAAFEVTLSEFKQVGLQFVEAARLKGPVDGGFNDQTGNLRSSIGFIVMYNGQEVHADFEGSPNGSDKATGLAKGRQYANEVAQDYKEGWAIITVAGMEYASWVEAKGYDVITGSTLDGGVRMEEATRAIDRALRKWERH